MEPIAKTHQETTDRDLLDVYQGDCVKPSRFVEKFIMSLTELFTSHKPPQRKSRDARKNEVDTAVRRLNACVAKTHAISEAARESYREAAESSRQVIECLSCPRIVEECRLNRDEFEDLP